MTTTINGDVGIDRVKDNTVTPSGLTQPLTLFTAKTTTSGTFIDFSPADSTGIPSWVKRITVSLNAISTNGASIVQLQLGTSAGFETTGYGGTVDTTSVSGSSGASFSTGLGLERSGGAAAINTRVGIATFVKHSGNTWVGTSLNSPSSVGISLSTTTKTLAGVLDRIRITTVNGTDSFDGGSINIMCEG